MTRSIILGLSMASMLAGTGCSSVAAIGESCATSSDCDVGLSCFNREGAALTPVCMSDCDLATTRTCTDGSVCLARMGGGAGVCYLGGMTALSAPCTGALECIQGSVCVNDGAATACRIACTVGDDTPCGAMTCLALMSGEGYCG